MKKQEEKQWEVLDQTKCEYVMKPDEWLDEIPRKGIGELVMFRTHTRLCLRVGYYGGKIVIYDDIYGTWGSPTRIR